MTRWRSCSRTIPTARAKAAGRRWRVDAAARSTDDGAVTVAPLRLAASAAALADDFARVRADLDVPSGFPPEVDAEANALAARGPLLPPAVPNVPRVDARDLELVTIDPPGSRDLDQAFHAARQGS